MTAAAAAEPPVRVDKSDSLDESGDLIPSMCVGSIPVVRALSGATCGRGAGTTRAPYGAEGGVHHGLPALRRLHRLPDGGSRAHAPPGGPPASMPNALSLSRARVWTGRKVQDGLGFRV